MSTLSRAIDNIESFANGVRYAYNGSGLDPAAKESITDLGEQALGPLVRIPTVKRLLGWSIDKFTRETKPATKPVRSLWGPGYAIAVVHSDLKPQGKGVLLNQDKPDMMLGPPPASFDPFTGDKSSSVSLGEGGEVTFRMDTVRTADQVMVRVQNFVLRTPYNNDVDLVPPGAAVANPEAVRVQVSEDNQGFHTVGIAGETIGNRDGWEVFDIPGGVQPKFVRLVDLGGNAEITSVRIRNRPGVTIPVTAVLTGFEPPSS